MCSFCVRLWGGPVRCACQRCLAPDEVIRTVTGVARLHCLYLAGVSVVRCQIVVSLVVPYFSVSVFQVRRLFSPGRVSVYSLMGADWTVFSARAGDSALPGLLHLHCRWDLHLHGRWYLHLHCVLESAPALPAHLHIHCILECSNKDSVFNRNWISSFLYRDIKLIKYKKYKIHLNNFK